MPPGPSPTGTPHDRPRSPGLALYLRRSRSSRRIRLRPGSIAQEISAEVENRTLVDPRRRMEDATRAIRSSGARMTFTSETVVQKTRKPHRCSACRAIIPTGEAMVRWAGMTDGEFGTAEYHTDCREAEIAINRLYDNHASEWVSLGNFEPEDVPWLQATFPVVAMRLSGARPGGWD